MGKDLTTLSPFPEDFKFGHWPVKWITKEEGKLIWPARKKLSVKECPECQNEMEIVSTEEINFVWHCKSCKSYFELG